MEEKILSESFARYQKLYTSLDLETLTGSEVTAGCPQIPARSVIRLCMRIQRILASESTLVQIDSPVSIVGDLHGHIGDLFRILKSGAHEKERYVFLGDYVDRGNFSVELILLLLLLKSRHPRYIILLRGNHEFDAVARTSGFYNEVMRAYGDHHVYDAFVAMFSYLPLAALIDNKILCVHGGIGPHDMSLQRIADIERPVVDFADDPVIASLVWSDPRSDVSMYGVSPRGTGFCYGDEAVKKYLAENGLTAIVRAHECVMEGVKSWFDGRVVTVFSASNYCGQANNLAGVLRVEDGVILRKTHPPLPFLKKSVSSYASASAESQMILLPLEGFSRPGGNDSKKPATGDVRPREARKRPEPRELCPISPLFLQAMRVTPRNSSRH